MLTRLVKNDFEMIEKEILLAYIKQTKITTQLHRYLCKDWHSLILDTMPVFEFVTEENHEIPKSG
jgi:hypothetical protein